LKQDEDTLETIFRKNQNRDINVGMDPCNRGGSSHESWERVLLGLLILVWIHCFRYFENFNGWVMGFCIINNFV